MRHLAYALLLLAIAGAAQAQSIEGKAALCAACHGANGAPANKSIPVIAGQNEGYLYLQLRDYKSGARKNATMTALVATLDKPAMKELAAYFAAKPWPDLGQPRAAAEIRARAETMDGSAACKGCHLDAWQGDSVTPRLAGQSKSYLRETMANFRSGDRSNNPWMAALLKTFPDDDIEAMAAYLAGY